MRKPGLPRWLAPIKDSAGISRWIFWSGLAIVAFFVVLAVFAPLLAPYGFDQVADSAGRFPKQAAPDGAHLFGTTVGSYDVLSRVIWGSRTAIEVVVLAVVFSLAIGVPLGLFSGYVGGRLDRFLVLVMDALFAFPYILLAIVIAFLLSDKLGQGVFTAAVAITAVYVPQYFRVVRNHVISIREESYVEAARGARGAAADDHQPLHPPERGPERARAGDAECRRRDPDARGTRLPRLRDPADRRGRVGLRPAARDRRRRRRHLVDRDSSRASRSSPS